MTIITLVLLLTLFWSLTAKVDRVVRAQGRVVPSEFVQIVQHLEGGVVSEILVREGEEVRAGQTLLRISDIQAESTVREREVRLASLYAEAERLMAEVAERRPDWDGVASPPETVARQREIYAARQDTLRLSLDGIDNRIAQLRAALDENAARRVALERRLENAQAQLEVYQRMERRSAGSRLQVLQAEGLVEDVRAQIVELDSRAPQLGLQIEEAQNDAVELVAEFRESALLRLDEVRVELSRLEQDMNAARDRLQRTAVLSPTNGTVNRIEVSTIGGVVRPGEPIMEITPDTDRPTIEAWVRPADRAEITSGLPVKIRVSAYNHAVYGTLEGRVTDVSSDTLPRENGNRFFRLRIGVDGESYAEFGRPLVPGMVATADIVLGERTVFQYLSSPVVRGLSTALQDSS